MIKNNCIKNINYLKHLQSFGCLFSCNITKSVALKISFDKTVVFLSPNLSIFKIVVKSDT